MNHKITLIGGFTDKEGNVHRDVTFGKRLKVKNLINLDANQQAKIPAQRQMLLVAASITAFGALKRGLAITDFFELDSIDIDDLQAGHDEFLQLTRGDKTGEVISDHQVRLAIGVEQNNVTYDLITFGRRLGFKHTVEAQRKGLSGVGRMLFETVAQIEKIAHSETGVELTAPFEDELFENLDIEDFDILFAGGELWRQSFRRSREEAAGERDAPKPVPPDEGNGNEQG